MLLEFLIAGNVLIGPELCRTDFILNGQLYTVEYTCTEDDMKKLAPRFEDY